MTKEEALLVGKAFKMAADAHQSQINKDGTPYILHPMRLAMRCNTADAMIVAILHDTIEDTTISLNDLAAAGFPFRLIDAIDALTKRGHEQGEEGYARAIERVAENRLATEIKILDLEDNMDLLRLIEVGDWELKRTAKYHRAWLRLKSIDWDNALTSN